MRKGDKRPQHGSWKRAAPQNSLKTGLLRNGLVFFVSQSLWQYLPRRWGLCAAILWSPSILYGRKTNFVDAGGRVLYKQGGGREIQQVLCGEPLGMQRPPQANVIYQFPKKTGAGRLSECSGLKCLKRLSIWLPRQDKIYNLQHMIGPQLAAHKGYLTHLITLSCDPVFSLRRYTSNFVLVFEKHTPFQNDNAVLAGFSFSKWGQCIDIRWGSDTNFRQQVAGARRQNPCRGPGSVDVGDLPLRMIEQAGTKVEQFFASPLHMGFGCETTSFRKKARRFRPDILCMLRACWQTDM